MMVTEAPSAHCGGVAIFYRESDHFAIKELRLHSPNIIRFFLVMMRWQWHIVGCYIAPQKYLNHRGRHCCHQASTLQFRDLSGRRPEFQPVRAGRHTARRAIADELVAAGPMDMGLHLLLQHKPWYQDIFAWSMQRDRQEVRYCTDYILGTDFRLFQDVAVQDM